MERRYIWFHTGPAFLVGTAGSLLAGAVAFGILMFAGANWWVFLLILALTAASLTPAFLVDQQIRRSRMKKTNRSSH